MIRGRLINAFLAELVRIDTAATAGAGGYDDDFRTVKTTYVAGQRTSARVDQAPIRVRCQIEPAMWETQRQAPQGNDPVTSIALCFHYRDLERADLIFTESGDPKIRVNDRLVGLYRRNGDLVQKAPGEGFYATKVDLGSGWLAGRRNILLVTFEDRAKALTS